MIPIMYFLIVLGSSLSYEIKTEKGSVESFSIITTNFHLYYENNVLSVADQ